MPSNPGEISPVNRRLTSRSLCLALAGALACNLIIFGAASFLLRGEPQRSQLETYHISAFLPPTPPPPPEEEEKPPPPPPPKPLKLQKLKTAPLPRAQPQLDMPQLELELAPGLSLGPVLAPPGPPPLPPGPSEREPMIRAQLPPPYPYLARRRGIQGAVTVRFMVDAEGRVRRLSIVKAEPEGVFEESVLKTVPRWRFAPGIKEGRPADTWVETVIRFKLDKR
jgi:periplasmic protein TonB